MYKRKDIIETMIGICDQFGLICYECFDINPNIVKFKIEDQYGDTIDIIKLDLISLNRDKMDDIWNKLECIVSKKKG